jgi:hypothetical protein
MTPPDHHLRPMNTAPQTRLSHPAVTSLAEGAALMERIAADRPQLIIDALLGGRDPEGDNRRARVGCRGSSGGDEQVGAHVSPC